MRRLCPPILGLAATNHTPDNGSSSTAKSWHRPIIRQNGLKIHPDQLGPAIPQKCCSCDVWIELRIDSGTTEKIHRIKGAATHKCHCADTNSLQTEGNSKSAMVEYPTLRQPCAILTATIQITPTSAP